MKPAFLSEHPPRRPPTTPSVSLLNLEPLRPPEKSEVRMGAGRRDGLFSYTIHFFFPWLQALEVHAPSLVE